MRIFPETLQLILQLQDPQHQPVRKQKPQDLPLKPRDPQHQPVRKQKPQDPQPKLQDLQQQHDRKQKLQDPQHHPVRKINKLIPKIAIITIGLIIQGVHQLIPLHLLITHPEEVGILPQAVREVVTLRQVEVGAVAHHPAAHLPEVQAVQEAEEDVNFFDI